MHADLLLDCDEFWHSLDADIRGARSRVLVQAMTFEGDSVGQQLAEALRASSAADRRLLVDSYSKWVINDSVVFGPSVLIDSELRREVMETRSIFDSLPRQGVGVRLTNPMGPLFVNYPARNHKKLMVIDDAVSYIGGFNFSEHNFSWHDMMLRIESRELAQFLASDFESTWRGVSDSLSTRISGSEFFVFNGAASRDLYERLFSYFRSAEKNIFVHSPYVTFPFVEELDQAAGRGVEVTVLSPAANNKPIVHHYLTDRAQRSGFELRLFQGPMSHLKAILVDDRYLICGSSNFDFISYYLEQEVVGVIEDAELVRTFRERVLEPDLATSVPCTEPSAPFDVWWSRNGLRIATAFCRFHSRLSRS